MREEDDGEAKLSGKSLLREENDVEAIDYQGSRFYARKTMSKRQIVREVAFTRGKRCRSDRLSGKSLLREEDGRSEIVKSLLHEEDGRSACRGCEHAVKQSQGEPL